MSGAYCDFIQIWDIGGNSLGAKMLANYVYGSSAILMVYDVTIAEVGIILVLFCLLELTGAQ